MTNHIKHAEFIVNLLENRFRFLGFHFGLDPILGLIPGGGDFISMVISFYLVWIAIQMELPQDKIAAMIGNILLDFIVGFIPLFGDIADFAFKSNTKNLKILKSFTNDKIIDGEEIIVKR